MAAEMYGAVRDTRIVSRADSDDEDELKSLRAAALRTMSKKKSYTKDSSPEISREIDVKDDFFVEQDDGVSSTSTEYEDISLNSPANDEECADSIDELSEEKDTEIDNLSKNWTNKTNSETRTLLRKRKSFDQIESLMITVDNEEESCDDDDDDDDENNEDDEDIEAVTSYTDEDNSNSEREERSVDEEMNESASEEMSDEGNQDMTEEENISEEETSLVLSEGEEQVEKIDDVDEDDEEQSVKKTNDVYRKDNGVKIIERNEKKESEKPFQREQVNPVDICDSDSSEVEYATKSATSQNTKKETSKTAKSEQNNTGIGSKNSVGKSKDSLNKDEGKLKKDAQSSSKSTKDNNKKDNEIKTQISMEKIEKSKQISPKRPKEEELHTDQLSIGGSSSESCDEFEEEIDSKNIKSKVEYHRTASTENKTSDKRHYEKQNSSRSRSRSHSKSSNKWSYNGKKQRSLSDERANSRNFQNSQRIKNRQQKDRTPDKNNRNTSQGRSPFRSRSPLRNRSPYIGRSPSSSRRNRRFSRRSMSPRRNRSPLRRSRSPTSTHRRSSPKKLSKSPLRRNLSTRSRSPRRSNSPKSRNRNSWRRSNSPPKKFSLHQRERSSERKLRQEGWVSKDRKKERIKSRIGTKDYDKTPLMAISVPAPRGRVRSPSRGRSPSSRGRSPPSRARSPLRTESPTKVRSLQKSVPLKSISSISKQNVHKNSVPQTNLSTKEKNKLGKILDSNTSKHLVSKKEKERLLVHDGSDARNLLSAELSLPSTKTVILIDSKQKKSIGKSELNVPQEKKVTDNTGDLRQIIKKTDDSLSLQDSRERELDERIAKIRLKNLNILKRNKEIQKEKELFG